MWPSGVNIPAIDTKNIICFTLSCYLKRERMFYSKERKSFPHSLMMTPTGRRIAILNTELNCGHLGDNEMDSIFN